VSGTILLGLVAVAVISIWAAARLIRARRLHRRGLGLTSEDRRLRDDPRFTELWVRQLKEDPPAGPDDRPRPGTPEPE